MPFTKQVEGGNCPLRLDTAAAVPDVIPSMGKRRVGAVTYYNAWVQAGIQWFERVSRLPDAKASDVGA
jgi:hypothetical protein